MSINNVVLIGRLGRAPELRHNGNNKAFAFLSVANTKKWNDQQSGQAQEKTNWIPVLANGKAAENAAQYLVQGQEVRIVGELQTRTKDINGQNITEVYVKAILIDYGQKPQGNGGGNQNTGGNNGNNQRSSSPQGGNGGNNQRPAHQQGGNGGGNNGGMNDPDSWDDDIPF